MGRCRLLRVAALAALFAVALGIRLPDLGNRPMHADEAVHAFKTRELWERGVYRYDANEFHGPTLYYAALPILHLRGRRSFGETTEGDYRMVTALFGACMVLLPVLLADGLGWPAVLLAGALMALSPSLVFYSRYAIQETLLLFFTLAALGCGWRRLRSGRPGWAIAAGVCAGLALATKETAAVEIAAAGLALALLRALGRHRAQKEPTDEPGASKTAARGRLWPRASLRGREGPVRAGGPSAEGPRGVTSVAGHPRVHLPLALLAAVTTAALFLSGFGSNPAGPVGYLRSFLVWGERAGAADLHRHPWHYYLDLVVWPRRGGPVWTEGLTLALALVGIAAGPLAARSGAIHCAGGGVSGDGGDESPHYERDWGSCDAGLVRFLGLYTLGLAAAYSLTPYKTPWCVLGMLQGMTLLGGVGGAALLRAAPGRAARVAVVVLLLAGIGHLGWQAHRASYVYAADGRNPYVYAETSPDVLDLADQVEGVVRAAPAGERAAVQVIGEDEYYWPLPWYLRRVPDVGYWSGLPREVRAPVVLASSCFGGELSRRLRDTHAAAGYYGLRSEAIYQLWVRKDLWGAYLRRRGSGVLE